MGFPRHALRRGSGLVYNFGAFSEMGLLLVSAAGAEHRFISGFT
jgi:hypothetical protein